MKIISIMILLLSIQVAAAIVNAAGGFYFTMQPQQQLFSSVQDNVNNGQYGESLAQTSALQNDFGDFLEVFPTFVLTVVLSIVAVPYLLIQFGVPITLSLLISLPIYFVYVLGIIQFASNRGTEGMR